MRTHPQYPVLLAVAVFVLHVRHQDFFASGFDRGRVFEPTEGAHDVCDFVSPLPVFDRSYLFS